MSHTLKGSARNNPQGMRVTLKQVSPPVVTVPVMQSEPWCHPPPVLSLLCTGRSAAGRASPTQVTVVRHRDEPGIMLFVICHLVRTIVIETKLQQSLV